MEDALTAANDEITENSVQNGEEIAEVSDSQRTQHLASGFSSTQVLPTSADSLPYDKLEGPGLERLCYSLIVAQGGVPRFFGNPGQAQYGIDLIVGDGDGYTVYQCKNVSSFERGNMDAALKLFEKKWLGHPQLPRPTKFVLCCPLSLRERRKNEDWTKLESDFRDRTGVQVEAWDKEYLDEQLKKRPDIVADLFSDQAAEQFCGLDDWNEDLFRPVRPNSGDPSINRYLEKKEAREIYLDAGVNEAFTQKLERHHALLILGAPGSGKTTTALSLAESFCNGSYRVFYINMRHDLSEDALVRGVRRRLARPTIFIVDDCHGKYHILGYAHDRLRGILARQSTSQSVIVYMARTVSAPDDLPRADRSDFVEEFRKRDSVLEFETTPQLFANIAALNKPASWNLSGERLGRIFSTTGRDLFLLDHLLDTIASPDEIDQLKPEHLFERALIRYFDQPTVHLPGFMMLTALAQFEIAPAVASFPYDIQKENPKAAAQLVVGAGHPIRYFFLHSSAAELVFRALAKNSGIENYAEAAALRLVDFFKNSSATDPAFPNDLFNLLRNHLKLSSDGNQETLLKGRFLADAGVQSVIEAAFGRLRLPTITLLLNIAKESDDTTLSSYRDLIEKKIDDGTVLRIILDHFDAAFLSFIKRDYAEWLAKLQKQFAESGLTRLVRTKHLRGLIGSMVTLIGQADFVIDEAALKAVDEADLDKLIEHTISSKASISTITLGLRDLKQRAPDVLRAFVETLSAKRILQLISSVGNINDLIMFIRYLPPQMAADLIDSVDDETATVLVERTLRSGRSVGTLAFTLKDLSKSDTILRKLEATVGVDRWWALMLSNGKINDIGSLMRRMDSEFHEKMVLASRQITLAQWEAVLSRSNLADVAVFARWGDSRHPKLFTPALLDQVSDALTKLIYAADWKILYLSGRRLSESANSPFKRRVLTILRQCLRDKEIDSLHFETFEEAASCVGIFLREAPGRKHEVIRSLFNLLPDPSGWYTDPGFVRFARRLLFLLASSRLHHEADKRMLDLCNDARVAAPLARSATQDVLLYLWNLYSVWFKYERIRTKSTTSSFKAFLQPAIGTAANAIVFNRLASGQPKDWEFLVSLCGFLYAAVGNADDANVLAEFESPAPFADLLKRAEQMRSPLIAAFFLIGIGWLLKKQDEIPKPVFSRILSKAGPNRVATHAYDNLMRVLGKVRVN